MEWDETGAHTHERNQLFSVFIALLARTNVIINSQNWAAVAQVDEINCKSEKNSLSNFKIRFVSTFSSLLLFLNEKWQPI